MTPRSPSGSALRGAAHREGADQIDRHDAREVRLRHRPFPGHHTPAMGDPGTVHGEREPPEHIDRLGQGTVDRGLGTHIGLDISGSGW